MSDEPPDPNTLSDLSCHYDSMLWTVTSLWAAAIGGLLAYCTSSFDQWLSLLGVGLTVCALYFAASFRHVRSRVQTAMPDNLRALHRSSPWFRQWIMFLLIFLALDGLFVRLLVVNRSALDWLWVLIGTVAGGIIVGYWVAAKGNVDPG